MISEKYPNIFLWRTWSHGLRQKNKSLMPSWRYHQLLSGFLAKCYFPRVSHNSRLSFNDKGDNEMIVELCTGVWNSCLSKFIFWGYLGIKVKALILAKYPNIFYGVRGAMGCEKIKNLNANSSCPGSPSFTSVMLVG